MERPEDEDSERLADEASELGKRSEALEGA
jgi:hypothetical protein